MEYIIKNGCYKDGQWIAYLQADETIFALGKTLKDANENLFSVLNEIAILSSTEGTNGLPKQKINQDYIKVVDVLDSYSKEFISKPILSFIYININDLTKDLIKTERPNVSIKKIYKNLAKKKGINISEFLNKKLKQELKLNI